MTATNNKPGHAEHDVAVGSYIRWWKRMAAGNLSEVKPVGSGVLERRIDWGPGYRVYFGRDGSRLVILLAGGTKQRQQQDIAVAQARWADFKRRKNS